MAPLLQNKTCDPFTPREEPCELGNHASYSINISSASDVISGVKFARDRNIRLIIKNTGHECVTPSVISIT